MYSVGDIFATPTNQTYSKTLSQKSGGPIHPCKQYHNLQNKYTPSLCTFRQCYWIKPASHTRNLCWVCQQIQSVIPIPHTTSRSKRVLHFTWNCDQPFPVNCIDLLSSTLLGGWDWGQEDYLGAGVSYIPVLFPCYLVGNLQNVGRCSSILRDNNTMNQEMSWQCMELLLQAIQVEPFLFNGELFLSRVDKRKRD